MKRVLLLFACALAGCDDRFLTLDALNTAPEIWLNNSEDELVRDSVKTSLKHGEESFGFSIQYQDLGGSTVESISVSSNNGGEVYYQGALVQGGISHLDLPSVAEGEIYLTFLHDGPKTYDLEVTVSDKNGATDKVTLRLIAFDNISPSASLQVTHIGSAGVGPYEYLLDGSESLDGDQQYGGAVQYYKFKIDDSEEIVKTVPSFKHNFSGPGGHSVELQVVDNDGATSSVVRKQFLIQ
jgi:hypothetical protein